MTETTTPIPEESAEPEIVVVDGVPMTTSIAIAQHFGKQHKDVLRAVRKLLAEAPEGCERNFALTPQQVLQPNGGTREEMAYRISRDGFSFLAMGFTGAKAARFKWAYIEAFNRMAKQLQDQAAGQGGALPPPPAQAPGERRGRRALALAAPALSPDLQTLVDDRAWAIAGGCRAQIRAWLTDEVLRNCIDSHGRAKPNLANTLAAATFEGFVSDWEAQRVATQLGLLDYVVKELVQVRRGLRARQRRRSAERH